jgi:hypothetical protein
VDAVPPDERMPEAKELQVHNKIQGWSEKSDMSALYAKRHIRRKADELGERVANSIGKGSATCRQRLNLAIRKKSQTSMS